MPNLNVTDRPHEYTTCPSCQRERSTLAVYRNNVRCHACGYYSREHELLTTTVPTAKELGSAKEIPMTVTLPSIESFEWSSKKIPTSVLDLYGVGIDSDGRIVSPHYSPDMQLIAYHTRTPGMRDFRMHGSNSPIGLHTLGGNKELIICEGHSDTYAAKALFPKCDVIGIPGSDTVNTLTPYLSRIRKYRRITIMTDGDDAGRKCGDKLVELLPRSKTYRASLAVGTDVCDYLVGDKHDDVYTLYKLATANKASHFVTDEDCDKYANDEVYNAVSTGIAPLDAMMGGGVGVAELTIITGYTGTGKSAIAQQIAVNAAQQGVKCMYVAGEMTPRQNLDRLSRQWFGFTPRDKEEQARNYKVVKDSILITKFSELSLSNVVDVIHEGVLDHGVKLVIVDVLSDIQGFLSTDMTVPAKIIKELHNASRGDELSGVPPCALLCVGHTKGNDEGRITSDDIRGGSVIRQEATCIVSIEEEKPGDLHNRNRVLHLAKRPRNRDFEPDDCTITYDTVSQRYTHNNGDNPHATQDSTDVRLPARRRIPPSTSSPSVPSEATVPVGNSTQAETIRVVDEHNEPSTEVTASTISESVQPGLLLPTEQQVHRDQGDTQSGRPNEVPASPTHTHEYAVHASSSTVTQPTHTRTQDVTGQTEQRTESDKLKALRTMYDKHPDILKRHRLLQETNHLVRDQLTQLGLLV